MDPSADAASVRAALTIDERAALQAILASPSAWATETAVALDGGGAVVLDQLVAADLVVRWPVAIGGAQEDLVTLTPWGAAVMCVEIDERLEIDEGEALEVPCWVRCGEGSVHVVLPKHARGYRLPFPELAADPESERVNEESHSDAPTYLIDTWSGEPIALFAGGQVTRLDRHLRGGVGAAAGPIPGVPIALDRRARRRRRETTA